MKKQQELVMWKGMGEIMPDLMGDSMAVEVETEEELKVDSMAEGTIREEVEKIG